MKKSRSSIIPGTLSITGLALIFLVYSCSKSNNGYGGSNNRPPNDTSSHSFLSVTNASPGAAMYDVYLDSTKLTTGGQLGFGSTSNNAGSPYYLVSSGNRRVRLSSNGTSYVVDSALTIGSAAHYTVFAYDTVNSGKLKTLILNDNLSVPQSGSAKVRFLNLSPMGPAENVLLIMGGDTTTINNLGYVGTSTMSADSLGAFKTVTAGTYRLVVNNAADKDARLFGMDSVNLASGGIYTLYSRGFATGHAGTADSLSVGEIQNF